MEECNCRVIGCLLVALMGLIAAVIVKASFFDDDKDDMEFYDDSYLDPSEKKAEGGGEDVDKGWWDED